MYYEARIHRILEVANALEAAKKIKSEEILSYHVIKWVSKDKRYFMYAVPDGHINNVFVELAILRQDIEGDTDSYQQVESITNGWIEGYEKLAKYLEESENSKLIWKSKPQLIIEKTSGNEIAWFECGCCGKGFKDNVKTQLEFDQDAGYGICSDCEKWH